MLDMKSGLLAEAVVQSLSDATQIFVVYRSSKPEETLALCRSCRANVLVMEVIRQGIWKLSERLKLCNAVKQLGGSARFCFWWMRMRTNCLPLRCGRR